MRNKTRTSRTKPTFEQWLHQDTVQKASYSHKGGAAALSLARKKRRVKLKYPKLFK